MANVKDDEHETLDFADESEWVDEVLRPEDDEFETTSWPASVDQLEPPPFWRPTYNGLSSTE